MSVKTLRDTQAIKIRAAYDYLNARKGQWVPMLEIAGAIQSMAPSTKLSQARELAAAEDCEIVWNGKPRESCYMLRPTRLGRDASETVPQTWDRGPYTPEFKLTP